MWPTSLSNFFTSSSYAGTNVAGEDLFHAVELADIKKIRLALRAGADPNYRGALKRACMKGNLEIVQTLLKAGAHPDEQSFYETTALHKACIFGHASIVKELLNYQANIDSRSGLKGGFTTPLFEGVHYDHIDCVEILLERGAVVDGPCFYNEKLALDYAISNIYGRCNKKMVRLLLDHGARFNDATRLRALAYPDIFTLFE